MTVLDKMYRTPLPGACNLESPHRPIEKRYKHRTLTVAVLCNRPSGHEGDHAWSTTTSARIYVWTQTGEVIR
jgi:hypothetical protein